MDEPGLSAEPEEAKVTGWAQLHEHEVVGWAIDADVSGHPVSQRPGPWLRLYDCCPVS